MRILIAVAVVSLCAACGASAPVEREIVVAMDEYRFLPSVIEVSAGQRVRLVLRNVGRTEHDFSPDQRGLAFGVPSFHLAPTQSASREWTAPNASTEIAVICAIPGHSQAGMTARLVIR